MNSRRFQMALAWIIPPFIAVAWWRHPGMVADISRHWQWAENLLAAPWSEFYQNHSLGYWPPLPIYISLAAGWVAKILGATAGSDLAHTFMKIPGWIAITLYSGVVMAYWPRLRGEHTRFPKADWLALTCACSPALLHNAAVYGQMDAIWVLLALLMFICLHEGRWFLAMTCLGVVASSTTLFWLFIPVILLWLKLKSNSWSAGKIWRGLLLALAVTVLLHAPLVLPNPVGFLHSLEKAAGVANFVTLNAANLYMLWGANWHAMPELLWGWLSPTWFGVGAAAVLVVALVAYVRTQRSYDPYLLGTWFALGCYLLLPGMWDRAYLVTLSLAPFWFLGSRRLWGASLLIQFGGLILQQLVLDRYYGPKYALEGPENLAVIIAFFFAFGILSEELLTGEKYKSLWLADKATGSLAWFKSRLKEARATPLCWRVGRRDFAWLALVLAFSFGVNLYQLGNREIPDSYAKIPRLVTTIELESPADRMRLFVIRGYSTFQVRCVGQADKQTVKVSHNHILAWREVAWKTPCSAVEIIPDPKYTTTIGELAFRRTFEAVMPKSVCVEDECEPAGSHGWFDERQVYETHSDTFNGGYFDEIYYARSAEELGRGTFPFENTHPPLGKIFIFLSTVIGGLSPFFWRLPGALAGGLLPVVLFWFTRTLGFSRAVAYTVVLISLLDFARIVMSRLATIDMMATTTIFMSYTWLAVFIRQRLLQYSQPTAYRRLSRGQIFLLACLGISLGISIAMKWTALFTIATSGLALITLLAFEVKAAQNRVPPTVWLRDVAVGAVVILLPVVVIYYASFALEYSLGGRPFDLAEFFRRQTYMYTYHSGLSATHPYGSKMHMWPFLQRPLWLSTDTYRNVYYSLSVFGNPVIWWGIVVALGATLYRSLYAKSFGFALITGIYLMQWLPWITANRVMFIYHYLPSLVAGWILLAAVGEHFLSRTTKPWRWQAVALSICLILWLMFWPIFMGTPTSNEYVERYLRWFELWVF